MCDYFYEITCMRFSYAKYQYVSLIKIQRKMHIWIFLQKKDPMQSHMWMELLFYTVKSHVWFFFKEPTLFKKVPPILCACRRI